VAIPKYTKGKLVVVPKNKEGQLLKSRIEAIVDIPLRSTAQLMAPQGTVDKSSVAMGAGKDAVREIKEWQAIMDYLRSLPVKNADKLPVIPVDERAAEVRAIRLGCQGQSK
jgi:5'-nucleotidase/UDP-sugar diphosphatase